MTDMHDSGERRSFSTGSIRDLSEDKPRIDLISPWFLERLGRWCLLGARKYQSRNWEMGQPFCEGPWASLNRHVAAWAKGARYPEHEDHLAAIAWNAMALIHYEEMIRAGVLPAELDDMPRYDPV